MEHLNKVLWIVVVGLALPTAPAYGQEQKPIAPLLDGLGDLHHPITTQSERAQRFFNQGLILAYAFNHAEAERAFREAARLDPSCAMCYWGVALVLGPNINAAMDDAAVAPAYEALQRARTLAVNTTEKEQAYIRALAERYAPEPADRAPLDEAYAAAMADVARRFPEDLDAATLSAEAGMNLHPWDFWTKEGEAKPWTPDILRTLESILERKPDHPGASHLYIHAVEAGKPELAIPASDRLRSLVPGAGHLVHMPSHIYIRVGRYHDASLANELAIASDQEYATQCHAQGIYPLAYMPHNHHFLWAAATLEGRSGRAIEAARVMAANIDQATMREPGMGTLQHYWITPLYALTRFGQWDEILATPRPDDDLVYPIGVWHYARGTAFLRTGKLAEARRELEHLNRITTDPALEAVTIWDMNFTADLLRIAADILAGELAAAGGDYETAVARLEAAEIGEFNLNYDEPPPWHFPVRQALGAVLLEAGRYADAERVYREDLERFPENGWSLFGLNKSLLAQGKEAEAKSVQQRFERAWQYADVTLTTSRF